MKHLSSGRSTAYDRLFVVLSCFTVLLQATGGRAGHVSEVRCTPALALQWRGIQETGVTNRRNRLKEPYRVTRSQAEGSPVRSLTLDLGSVLFGENTVSVGLSNSSAAEVPVSVHLAIEGGAESVGPRAKQVRLDSRSPAPNQGVATFGYRVTERGKPIRFSVRVLGADGAELATASRGAVQPYHARLYADTCRIWQGDAKLGFRVKYQLAPAELSRARTKLALARDGKALWQEDLPPATERCLRGKLDVSGLSPGTYSLTATVTLDGRVVERSRQALKVREPRQIGRARIALVVGVPPGNPGGVQSVTGGVPFPDGALSVPRRVRIIDEDGNETLCQADATQFWAPKRRFVRWLLVSFRADPKKKYFLEYGSQVRRRGALPVATAAADGDAVGAVQIDTGKLRFELKRDLNVGAEAFVNGRWRVCARGKLGLGLKILHRGGLDVLLSKARDPDGVTLLKLPRTGWRFKLDPDEAGTKARWFAPDLDDRDWSPIQTEIFWEKQGYDYDGAGWYRTQFSVPEAIVGQKLLMHFGAVDEWGHVYVNGKDCGGNENVDRMKAWVTPFAVDVSAAVKAGENDLAVRVHDSAGAGGIWKPVALRLVNPSEQALRRLARDDPDSGDFRAQSAVIAVEENGPQRAVIRVDGKYRRGDREVNAFRLRIIARHGEPYLQMEHTLVYDQEPANYLIGGLSLDWPALGQTLAVPGPKEILAATKTAELQTLSCDQYRLTADGKTQTVDGRPLGWVDVAGPEVGTMLLLRDIWRQWPGAVAASPDRIHVSFWPAGRQLDLRNIQDNFPGSDARGLAKTQRVLVLAHAPKADDRSDWGARLDAPLTVMADPQWTSASEVVGPIRPYDPENYPGEEVALEHVQAGMELQQDHYKVYGLLDYGDFHHRWDRDKNQWMKTYRYWVNNETTYDPCMYYVWHLLLRSGNPHHFRFMEARQMHLIDVDTCHSDLNLPERVPGGYASRHHHLPGIQHRHDRQHWNGSLCHHHTTIEDPLLFYYLTGNRRGLDVAEELRRTAERREIAPLGSSSHRDFSMPGRFAFELYTHFGDAALLDYALDSWETMRLYQGPGGRAINCYRRVVALLEDERFVREYLMTDIVDESQPQSPLAELCKGKMEAYLFLGDKAGAEYALSVLKGVQGSAFPGISAPLSKHGARPQTQPVGYGWIGQIAGKYLPHMELAARAGVGTKPAGVAKATKAAGKWRDAATWEGGQVPGPDHDVVLPSGSTVVYDGPKSKERTCRSITVLGKLTFASGEHTVVPHGSIEIKTGGALEMGPGATLLFDCKWSGDFGLTVDGGGALRAKGSAPQKRDCRIGALRTDGDHNGYIHLKRDSVASFENCEISYLGGGALRKYNQGWSTMHKLGIQFGYEITGCVVEGCEIHHCVAGILINKSPTHPSPDSRITNNEIHHCQVGLVTETWMENLRIADNVFRNNAVGIDVRGGAYKKAWITGNRFEGNQIGFDMRWRGGSLTEIAGNTYVDNDVAISLMANHQEVVFQNEVISGGRIGIRIEGDRVNKSKTTRATFTKCRIGVDKPTQEANLLVEKPVAQIKLKACKLGEPRKIAGHAETVEVLE